MPLKLVSSFINEDGGGSHRSIQSNKIKLFCRSAKQETNKYFKTNNPVPRNDGNWELQSNETRAVNFFLNNQQDALIIQIYSVIKLYMFRASSLPTIRSFVLYIRRW